jgi:putative serine protease PepD
MVVIAAVVAAVVGGASGAGIVLALEPSSTSASSNNLSGPSSITVENTKDATTITAVAAKALPSIVTINATTSQEAGTGSGIILTPDGYVVTNNHVVTLDGESADPKIQVETSDGRIFGAKVVGTDPIDDLAVIKLQGVSGLQPAQFADSSKLNVGDMAIAIGAPLGLSGSVTNGIISALNRSITVQSSAAPTGGDSSGDGSNGGNSQNSPFNFWNFGNGTQTQTPSTTASSTISLSVIQTDAAINPGNSGGALLDSEGKVIGINCAIASASDTSTSDGQPGSIGVGFAIPSNIALRIADDIIKSGSATHGLLGVTVEDVTTDGSATTSKVVGAKIESVTTGDPASRAGVHVGDVVTNFNGIPITNANDLTAQVRAMQAGSRVSLTYVRNGKSTKVTVTLGELQ